MQEIDDSDGDDRVILTELARRLSRRSKGTLSRTLKAKGLLPDENGRFSEDEVRRVLTATTDPSRAKSFSGVPVAAAGVLQSDATEAELHAHEAISIVRRILREEGRSPNGALTFDDARTAETIVKVRQRDQDMAVASGRVVDGDAVHEAAFQMGRIERDAWMNWPARVSPLMAAELGIDQIKLAVTMEKYVRQHLAERSQREFRLASH